MLFHLCSGGINTVDLASSSLRFIMSSRRVDSRFPSSGATSITDPPPTSSVTTCKDADTIDELEAPKVNERVDDEDDLVFEALYDLTDERLSVLFSSFDTDADGRIDYESLKRGLREWQDQAGVKTSALEEEAFAAFVSTLDDDSSQDLSYEEFCEAFRLIMLRTLISHQGNTDKADGSALDIIEYNSTRIHRTKVGDSEDQSMNVHASISDFFFKKRPNWVKTRWVDIVTDRSEYSNEAINLTMKRIAVKYLLHPLALEDVLETSAHRPKVEVFSSHYFLIIPVFTIVDTPISKPIGLAPDKTRSSCFLCWSNRQDNKRSRYRSQSVRVEIQMVSVFVNIPRNDTLITFAPSGSSTSSSHLWRRVRRELEKPYSKLRQYDAQYLTYALLDQSVDLLVPVVKSMRREINDEHQYLRSTEYSRGLRRIHEIKSNLERVNRTIKPFMRVLTHSIEDEAICPGVTFYLRDALDNLENIDDELRQLVEQCQAIDLDADKYHDRQMNRTLYILTVVSAIFLPAQFLTGVWGMNFIQMEELQQPWGYDMFWIVVSVMTISLLILFCAYGRLRTVED